MDKCTSSPAPYASHVVEHVIRVIFGLLTGASAFMTLYWLAGIVRLRRTMRAVPTLRAGLDLPPSGRSACVIVPAHNEEGSIGRLVRSLRAQDHPRLRVVVALDRCTDATRDEARREADDDERFEFLEIDACPPDWAGKVNAICKAVRRSRGAVDADLLIFTDADTEYAPECVRAAAALFEHRRLDLASLISSVSTGHWFERVVQPAAGLELFHHFPILRANGAPARRPFANGQFIMMTREAYDRLGGHEAVREALLEDLALARLASRAGMRAGVFLADGLLTVHMYDSWDDFRRGWERIFIEVAGRRVGRLRRAVVRKVALGVVLPSLAVVGGLAGAAAWALGVQTQWAIALLLASIAAPAAMFACLHFVYRVAGQPAGSFWTYPRGAWEVSRILRRAARVLDSGEPVRWGGREYVLEAR